MQEINPVKSRLLFAPLILALAGCSSSLVGTWKAVEEAPQNPSFFIKQIQFRDNGDYYASARESEKDLFLKGPYSFNGHTLTMKLDGRPDRSVTATNWWGRELRLSRADWSQTLKKE